MDESTQIVGGVLSLLGSLGLGVKWAAMRFAKLEKDLHASHASSLAECQKREEALVSRVQALETRAHTEDREDRAAMLRIMDQSASALAAIAHRLPDPTPPRGNEITPTHMKHG